MNKFLTAALTAALIGTGSLASAQTTLSSGDVSINPNEGKLSGFLNTDMSWQVIQLPLSAVNGVPLDQLRLSTTGLPEGLSVSLARAIQIGNTLVLNVDVERSNANAVPHGLATVTLLAGGAALTTFQVPVEYVSYLSQ
ncbi:hypothetical protein [Deinococcus sp.]|uniref:hypothetical protein n=1 Tax=Deinococcus sp. TaxID=47478 RepID=UPI003C7D1A48